MKRRKKQKPWKIAIEPTEDGLWLTCKGSRNKEADLISDYITYYLLRLEGPRGRLRIAE